MWTYCFRLAWLSLCRTPVMSALTILTVAVGIATCLTVFTLYRVISSNPMAHKNDQIVAVQLDSFGEDRDPQDSNGLPVSLTFRDARALFEANIANQTVVTVKAGMNISTQNSSELPTVEFSRLTTNDFFTMFDVPFIYGSAWSEDIDMNGGRVAVISESINQRLFSGKNPVGEAVVIEGDLYTVTGVVDDAWRLVPTVFDLTNNYFEVPPQIYVPLFNLQDTVYPIWANFSGWKNENIATHQDLLNSERTWLKLWFGFADDAQRQKAEQYVRDYITGQKKVGRFERPLKFQFNRPSEWLEINKVVNEDDRVLLVLSFAFLFVCLVNAAVLLLAKFFRKAPEAGVRRALGASRLDILIQHLAEAFVIAAFGSLMGLGLTWFGLMWVRSLYTNYEAVAVMSFTTAVAAVCLSLGATLISGLIPAWRISHTQAARYLKAQ